MKLLFIFAVCITLAYAKVIDGKGVKYNERDSKVKREFSDIVEIVPFEKNTVVQELIHLDKDNVIENIVTDQVKDKDKAVKGVEEQEENKVSVINSEHNPKAIKAFVNMVKVPTDLKNASVTSEQFIVKYQTILYKEKSGRRMVEVVYTQNDLGQKEMIDCFLIGDEGIGKQLLEDLPAEATKTLEKDQLTKLVDSCSEFLVVELSKGTLHDSTRNQLGPQSTVNRGLLDSLFIFPGTKWCGPGDVAHDYDDLGSSHQTDLCCRSHDHCFDYIPARGEKYGLKNQAFYTASHCNCDRNFTQCLLKADTFASHTVGCLYFNLLQTRCFEKTYPISKCLSHSGWIPLLHWSCQQYELNTNAGKIWQFFDAKRYEASDSYKKFQAGLNQINN